jgi:hypothetical protein
VPGLTPGIGVSVGVRVLPSIRVLKPPATFELTNGAIIQSSRGFNGERTGHFACADDFVAKTCNCSPS